MVAWVDPFVKHFFHFFKNYFPGAVFDRGNRASRSSFCNNPVPYLDKYANIAYKIYIQHKARYKDFSEVVILAGNKDSGRVLAFKMSEKELKSAIEQYKQDAENGKFPRASWPHFCARLGYTEAEVAEVIQRGGEVVGAYSERAVLLQRMLTWIRGEMLSGAGWSGQNQTKAIFALKQNHGDGVAYADGNGKQSGPVEVKISFGGNDARAKKAGK